MERKNMRRMNSVIWTLVGAVVATGLARGRECKAISSLAGQSDRTFNARSSNPDKVAAAAWDDPEREAEDREQERRDQEMDRMDRQSELYNDGTEALDEHRWERA